MAPTTMPPIAPPERAEEGELESGVFEGIGDVLEVVGAIEDVLEGSIWEVLACVLATVKVEASLGSKAARSSDHLVACGSAEE